MEGSDPLRIVANLTHELKTPLHAILSTASLLKSGVDGILNSEQQKQVEIILRNGENLLEMITSLLSYSSTLTESRPLTVTKINPSDFIRSLYQQIQPLAVKKKIDFNFQNSSICKAIYTDKDLLNRLISNILSNAIKFTPENGRVEIALMDTKNKGVRIQIADTGKGMSIESKMQVFNAFYQEDSSSTREYGGVGLGLSLVKHAADQIQAMVKVDSELDQGSIFTVDVPSLENQFIPKKILLLETDESLKTSLGLILEREGYLYEFINSSEMEDYLSKSSVDLIIIDSAFFSGESVLKIGEIRGIESFGDGPILVLTNSRDFKYRSMLIESGISEVISKPLDVSELLTKIKALILSQ